MKLDRNPDPDAVVVRSREVSEDRWPAIKGELEDAKFFPLIEDASCPLVEADDRTAFPQLSPSGIDSK